MSYAQMATAEVIDEPVSNTRDENLAATRVIWYPGDDIPPHEKHEMSNVKGFGGRYMPQLRTLPKNSKGMIYRCKFTALTTRMRPEALAMIPPDVRDYWDKSYEQTTVVDGQAVKQTITGFMGSDLLAAKEGRFVSRRSSHIAYRKRFPGHDVRMAIQRSMPNGVGGVVEIEALVGSTEQERQAVQNFFFPEWAEIEIGLASLPDTSDELEAHIKRRLSSLKTKTERGYVYNDGLSVEYAKKLESIGADMLKACEEYKRTGVQVIEKDENAFKSASKVDEAYTHSPISEHLLPQLKYRRKSELITDSSSAVDRLADIMLKKEAGGDAVKLKELEIAERQLFLEEVKLGIRNPDGSMKTPNAATPDVPSTSPVIADDEETEIQSRLCGQPKANNEPCKRVLKPGEMSCFQHPIE